MYARTVRKIIYSCETRHHKARLGFFYFKELLDVKQYTHYVVINMV